jgi:hypothetical protein
MMGLLFIAMMIAAIAGTRDALVTTGRMPHGRWARLSRPPERLVDLLGPACTAGVGLAVFGRSETGSYFSYHTYRQPYWKLVDVVPTPNPRLAPCRAWREEHVPRPPRSVVDQFHTEVRGSDYYYHGHFGLAPSGELWLWRESGNALRQVIGIPAAYLFSLVLAFAAWIHLWRRSRQVVENAPSTDSRVGSQSE